MTKRITVTDYCDACQDVTTLYRHNCPGVIQWICSVCGSVVDSDFDNEYDGQEYVDEDDDDGY